MNSVSTTCPDVGAWRAWLDGEEHAADLATHLEGCAACQRSVAELRQDATLASNAIGALSTVRLPSRVGTAVARERLAWRQRMPAAANPAPALRTGRNLMTPWRLAASGLAAAMIVTTVVAFTPEGRTAAAGILAQFRSRQVAAVEVTAQSQADISRTLSALGNLGTLQMPGRAGGFAPTAQGSVTLAEASRTVGFSVQTPDPATLPAGIDRTPRVQVIQPSQMRFTFDKAKAQRHLQASGQQVTMPDKFNGATLVVSTPAAALLEYSSQDTHQTLIIGQAGELVIDVQGQVTLDELRDFLLSLPGLPEDTVRQLKLIRNWRETLPIPIPTDHINWQPATFKGNQGLLLNDNTGVGSAAVWQSGGHLYGVAGSLKATELKRVADSLAVR